MTGNERPCPDDLIVRAQRHAISELERRALAAHLAQCDACRASAALAGLFAAIPDAQPGDDQRTARVTEQACRPHRLARTHGLRTAAMVALVALSSGVAVAAWLAHQAAQAPIPAGPAPEPRASRARDHAPRRPAAQAEAPQESPPPVAPAPPAEVERRRRPAARAAEAVPASEPVSPVAEPTPASLFAHANAVRRAGEVREAIALYQDLRQRFPDSPQAQLSAISQGDLLLGEGEPAKAIAAYAAYLQAAPSGRLAQEALFGKARGLGLLGRNQEERRTWEELARRFPHSAYRPAAARRLQELTP